MRAYLMFHLAGVLSAWGDNLAGRHRPTSMRPGKSHVIGLLACALGYDRQDKRIVELSKAIGYAVRVETRQGFLQDYQTFRVPRTKLKPTSQTFFDRRDEVRDESLLETSLSWREYQVHASYTVALWVKDAANVGLLEELSSALKQPKGLLFLGRKACQLCAPLRPVVLRAATLRDAFGERPMAVVFKGFALPQPEYYYDGPAEGFVSQGSARRRDEVIGLSPRRYGLRIEHMAV